MVFHRKKRLFGSVLVVSEYFLFLLPYDDAQIAAVLAADSAQTIAIVLGNMRPERAAGVLRRLPGKLASEVSLKLARAEKVEETVIAAAERALRKKFFNVIPGSVRPGE